MAGRKAVADGVIARGGAGSLLALLAAVLLLVGLPMSGCAARGGGGGGGGAGAPDGDAADEGEVTPEEPEDNPLIREIEEADIVKLQDGYFYLANRYTGLRIIDARTIERPELVGGLPVAGRGVELYVDEDRVFMVNSADFFTCAGEPVSYEDAQVAAGYLQPDYSGSRVTIVDVSDPTAPAEISHFDMDGFAVATRRVGEVIYATGNFEGTEANGDDVGTDGGDAGTDGVPDDGEDDGGLPPASSTGEAAVVGADGQGTATATSPGGVYAEFRVSGAPAGGIVQLTVADGNIHDDYVGIPGGQGLPLTVTVTGDLEDAAYTADLPIEFDAALLDEFDLSLDHWAVYRYDAEAARWVAAAINNVGSSQPTDTVGDFGFYVETGHCWSNDDCDAEAYCYFAACMAETGACARRPDECAMVSEPVCGCDGVTYDNACLAAQAGTSADYAGECDEPTGEDVAYEADVITTYAVWAVVDRLGDYAVGQRFDGELTITITPSDGGTVTVDPPDGPYTYGQTVTLTAVPNEGFAFTEWTAEPAAATAPTPETLEVVLTESLEIGAVFQLYVPSDIGPYVFVVSIDISDPDNIRMVDRVDVPGESLDIHVTPNAIYVLGDDPTMSMTTRVIYVDISDPAGDVEERDTFRVPGLILNRFFTDEYEGIFRIVTEDFSESAWTPVVALYNYDVSDPDDVIRLGRLVIELGESLRSVRFDGIRGYAVTFEQVDPLFVLDLEDPDEPVVAGEIEVPGWSTYLTPLGERLVGVGFDDRAGFRPAVVLYDVADPASPRQLSRIVLGERWSFDTTSEATVDEKALKVLEDEELILVPISSYDEDEAKYVDSLQLIDLLPTSLAERGLIDHRGLVRRAGVEDTRLWVLSDEAFQVADIDDRDEPESLDVVDIMSEQDLLDAGLADCVDSAYFEGFPVEEWWFWGGDMGMGGFSEGGGGACGAVGLIGLGLSFSALVALSLTRPRRR